MLLLNKAFETLLEDVAEITGVTQEDVIERGISLRGGQSVDDYMNKGYSQKEAIKIIALIELIHRAGKATDYEYYTIPA
jgi:hypothetical protein